MNYEHPMSIKEAMLHNQKLYAIVRISLTLYRITLNQTKLLLYVYSKVEATRRYSYIEIRNIKIKSKNSVARCPTLSGAPNISRMITVVEAPKVSV